MENNFNNKKIILAAVLIFGALIYGAANYKKLNNTLSEADNLKSAPEEKISFQEEVIPSAGVELPAKWGDLGKRLIETGAIDAEKFEAIYAQRGGLSEADKKILYGEDNGNLKINSENSGFILNMLWALGLANKNPVLENGPMADEKYGGAGRFASTGGWNIAKGDAMSHYSKHSLIILNENQQALVEKVSQNIYRPCCGNSTYFPDCNHGMAMLGLLELMASRGVGEDEMYKIALSVNSYWFPDTYLTLAKYFEKQGVDWKDIDAKKILGANYSSASGYQSILSQIEPERFQGGGGCGI